VFPNEHQRRRFIVCALVVSLVAPLAALADEGTAAAAPPGTGRVKARVFGSNGKTPVAGAILHAYHLDSGKVYSSSPATGKGDCELKGLPYGYLDIAIETKEGTFVGNQVVNVPPDGTVTISLTLTKYAERTPAWWSGKTPRQVPGTRNESQGIAELNMKSRGQAFWTSPGGLAIIGGATGLVLLALTGQGGGSSSSVSPSSP
jgi:hypothetical protein